LLLAKYDLTCDTVPKDRNLEKEEVTRQPLRRLKTEEETTCHDHFYCAKLQESLPRRRELREKNGGPAKGYDTRGELVLANTAEVRRRGVGGMRPPTFSREKKGEMGPKKSQKLFLLERVQRKKRK